MSSTFFGAVCCGSSAAGAKSWSNETGCPLVSVSVKSSARWPTLGAAAEVGMARAWKNVMNTRLTKSRESAATIELRILP